MSLRVAAAVRKLDSFMDEEAPPPAEITRILHEWRAGSREAFDRLIPIVYNELKTLASRQLAHTVGMCGISTGGVGGPEPSAPRH